MNFNLPRRACRSLRKPWFGIAHNDAAASRKLLLDRIDAARNGLRWIAHFALDCAGLRCIARWVGVLCATNNRTTAVRFRTWLPWVRMGAFRGPARNGFPLAAS